MAAGASARVEERTYDATAPEETLSELFERLKDEIRHAHGADIGDETDRSHVRSRLRSVAEHSWIVRFARPLERRAGLRGAVFYPVKLCLGRLIRWYVEPFATDQRGFNGAVLKLADELFEEVDLLFAKVSRLELELERAREQERGVGELGARVRRLERARVSTRAAPGDSRVTVAAQPRATAIPDYFAFELQMRGSSENVRARQSGYVTLLRPHAPVLDAGCGRGEMLALLREAGIAARGVDADGDMVACAAAAGLDVAQADVEAHLEHVEPTSLGAIFSAQLVEHLPPPALVRFLELARTRLRPGGLLVLETINPASPLALRNYFADLTHSQPLVPETLRLLVEHAGFDDVELVYLNEPAERLVEVELPDREEFDRSRAALTANVRRLNELLFGPLDYAVHARVPELEADR